MTIFSLILAATPVIWMGWDHEPDDFLNRRGGRGNGSTYGEWVPKCYDRLHSEELMKKAIEFSDGVVKDSRNSDKELYQYAGKLKKARIDCSTQSDSAEKLEQFYDSLF